MCVVELNIWNRPSCGPSNDCCDLSKACTINLIIAVRILVILANSYYSYYAYGTD